MANIQKVLQTTITGDMTGLKAKVEFSSTLVHGNSLLVKESFHFAIAPRTYGDKLKFDCRNEEELKDFVTIVNGAWNDYLEAKKL
jgi:hypothetical protein